MASPDRYFDPLPRPKGFPRPVGDLLASDPDCRLTREMRGTGSPIAANMHGHELRDMMIAHAVIMWEATHEQMAEATGLSRSRITHIVTRMEGRISKALGG